VVKEFADKSVQAGNGMIIRKGLNFNGVTQGGSGEKYWISGNLVVLTYLNRCHIDVGNFRYRFVYWLVYGLA
jgi:hypothetical protein